MLSRLIYGAQVSLSVGLVGVFLSLPITLHRCLLAYVSDYWLLDTSTMPHGSSFLRGNLIMASIDHAIWFHRHARLDDWLLYSIDSPSAQSSRGLARGMIYDRDGHLVASTAQEGLIRVVQDGKK